MSAPLATHGSEARRDWLMEGLEHARHLLPSQAPLAFFVHHNPLHSFEHLDFHAAVREAGVLYGAEPYMKEETYRQAYEGGRIRRADLEWALDECTEAPDEVIVADLDRRALRWLLLRHELNIPDDEEIAWLMGDSGLGERLRPDVSPEMARRFRGRSARWLLSMSREQPEALLGTLNRGWAVDLAGLNPAGPTPAFAASLGDRAEELGLRALWAVCQASCDIAEHPSATRPPFAGARYRDLWLQRTGEDLDGLVHGVLIRLAASYLDEGIAYWRMPRRGDGFFRCAKDVLRAPSFVLPQGLSLARAEVAADDAAEMLVQESIRRSLEVIGQGKARGEDALVDSLLTLPGFAGMFAYLEAHPPHHDARRPTLVDFAAIKLLLERAATLKARTAAASGARDDAPAHDAAGERAGPFSLFQVAQCGGLTAKDILGLDKRKNQALWDEIAAFDEVTQRKVWHLAYERRHRQEVLTGIQKHRARVPGLKRVSTPKLQAFFCIDDREESLRRAIEEQDPQYETFGAAGFYGIAMAYRGLDEAHHRPLCPVVIDPHHEIDEVADGERGDGTLRAARRRSWGRVLYASFVGSRGLLRGLLATLLIGPLVALPLVFRVLFPRLTARLNRHVERTALEPLTTTLTVTRQEQPASAGEAPREPAEDAGGRVRGYTREEQVQIVWQLFHDAGLQEDFAPLVAIVGHGSKSLNNPHEAAHDCGACGGGRGGPNARAFALMANDPQVRAGVKARGIEIPTLTWIVGAYHDTADDSMPIYDEDLVPDSHRRALGELKRCFDVARRIDALERVRRFESVAIGASIEQAVEHAEGRAENLAEPRPEYGHATNAIMYAGRRSVTRGLFLDRRAFLFSYDYTLDPDGAALARLLGAGIPVCAGINLEYYFSLVDNERYGAGTKLPHNITGLVGVMNGSSSDLRTGLPWQMVEIHEPVRLLNIIEAPLERMEEIMRDNATVGGLIERGWVQLTVLDPETGAIQEYRHGTFIPFCPDDDPLPRVASSQAWFEGRRDHLAPCTVDMALSHGGPS